MRDFGMFGQRKADFWVWVILPPVLVIAVAVARASFSRHLALTERQYAEAVQDVPEMESSLQVLRGVVATLNASASEDDLTTEAFGHKLYSAAAKSALTINALSADKEGEDGKINSVRASLKVEGPLIAIVRFLSALQSDGMLITVGSARLRATRHEPDVQYEMDVVLRAYRFAI